VRIEINLDDSIAIHEAKEMVENFNKEPWCHKAEVKKGCEKKCESAFKRISVEHEKATIANRKFYEWWLKRSSDVCKADKDTVALISWREAIDTMCQQVTEGDLQKMRIEQAKAEMAVRASHYEAIPIKNIKQGPEYGK
jgi:hypothetical protein